MSISLAELVAQQRVEHKRSVDRVSIVYGTELVVIRSNKRTATDADLTDQVMLTKESKKSAMTVEKATEMVARVFPSHYEEYAYYAEKYQLYDDGYEPSRLAADVNTPEPNNVIMESVRRWKHVLGDKSLDALNSYTLGVAPKEDDDDDEREEKEENASTRAISDWVNQESDRQSQVWRTIQSVSEAKEVWYLDWCEEGGYEDINVVCHWTCQIRRMCADNFPEEDNLDYLHLYPKRMKEKVVCKPWCRSASFWKEFKPLATLRECFNDRQYNYTHLKNEYSHHPCYAPLFAKKNKKKQTRKLVKVKKSRNTTSSSSSTASSTTLPKLPILTLL